MDYKFGNPVCGDNLAGAPEYSDTAFAAIEAMLEQEVPVIVRISYNHWSNRKIPMWTGRSSRPSQPLGEPMYSVTD